MTLDTTKSAPAPAIPGAGHLHPGAEVGTKRRTIVDDRTGIVVDINQAGPDARPTLYVELYPWHGRNYTVQIDRQDGHHPGLVLTRVDADAKEAE